MVKTVMFSRGSVIKSLMKFDTYYVIVYRDDYNKKSPTRVLVPMEKRDASSPFDIYSRRYNMVVESTSPVTLELTTDQFVVDGKLEKMVMSEICDNLRDLVKKIDEDELPVALAGRRTNE